MRVLVTRAEPAASRTAKALRHEGFEPVVMPLFEVQDTGEDIPGGSYNGIIFTSSNAVHIFSQRQECELERYGPTYCVGKRTAEAAQRLGFDPVLVANGNARDLADLIAKKTAGSRLRLLYAGAEDYSFDMKTALESRDAVVVQVAIYRVSPIMPESEQLKLACKQIAAGCVLAYSERTALHTASILFGGQVEWRDNMPFLVAISNTVAESVLKYPWQKVYAADTPSERAMLDKLKSLTLR